MPTDTLGSLREKARYILEIRYPPLVQAFDRRGKVLEVLFPRFRQKLEHWRTENVEVTIANNLESPSRAISVGHLRSSIIYEDPGTRQEFLDDSRAFIAGLEEVFPEGLKTITRLGFRSIGIVKHETASSFDEVFASVRSRFLHPQLPTTLRFTDCAVTLEQENCRVMVGPVKTGEDWVRNAFAKPESNVPAFGIGLDVDCYSHDLDCGSPGALAAAARALGELALKIEEETIAGVLGHAHGEEAQQG